ncbi:DUF624 domain-containing protein [Rhodophyticola sp. CCM32]|uniref:DUF624 domain-containing protein n=1 Tax=Rhodophyticola sp. CCM32 TaxID=2916397 RepID=UPI00107FB01A|nr:DUF624 domain-containing protein [Rhodophyticola sp. CCM32]QBY01223.1 DUF624 domain-containing protein [Rhodophyticola sp. CCM32]
MVQNAIIKSCNVIWRYCAVNLMVLALTLAGGVVLGLAPAIAASYWAMARPEMPLGQIAKGMFAEWRCEFLRTNALMVPMVILAVGLSQLPQAAFVPVPVAVIALVLVTEWTIAALYSVSFSRATLRETATNAMLIIGGRPVRLLIATLAAPVLVLLATWQSLLVPYGLFSIHAAIVVGLLGSMRDPSSRPLALPTRTLEAQS